MNVQRVTSRVPPMNERQELIELYKQKHREYPRYGVGKTMHDFSVGWLRAWNVRSVIDYGCGKGQLVQRLHDEGFRVRGYDPAVPGFTDFPESPAEACLSFDVFEHFAPAFVDKELERVSSCFTRVGLFYVATRPAVHKLADGRNCHTVVESPKWWRRKIREVINAEVLPLKPEPNLLVAVVKL